MKQNLEAILRHSVEGKAWHGPSVCEAIEGVDAVLADRRVGSSHTIHELVLHIAAWMDEAAERLYGRKHEEPLPGNFPPPVDWAQSRQTLHSSLEKLLTAVREKAEDSHLEPLAGVAQHNAYHAGQIVTLRNLSA